MQFTDAVSVTEPRITRDGYLVAQCRVARTGIQHYRSDELGLDGPVRDVPILRDESAVFNKNSMQSFTTRPLTRGHPSAMVSADTWQRSGVVGTTGETVARDGEYLVLPLLLCDSETIKDVNNGVKELSCGYTSTIRWEEGETADHQKFLGRMEEISGNHIAIVPKGRAGTACRLGDAWTTPTTLDSAPSTTKDHRDMPETLRNVLVDGYTIATTDQGAQAIEKLQRQIADMSTASGRRDAEFAALRDSHTAALNSVTQTKDGELAGLRATHASAIEAKDGELAGLRASHTSAIDALTGEVAALKAKQPDAAQMDALIADRANIIDAARKILGDKFDPKGKSNADVRRAAVEKRLGATAVADKSDDYIGAAFDTLTAVGAGAPPGRDPVRDHFVNTPAPRHQSQDMNDADAAHDKYVDEMRNAWKGKTKESV